ncbi:GNAT family N-acetyltransferase [Bacillus thermotolerans]|uniref:GNAT family N-acetyltransferase n=1 Tax=Bacillus thermotolerans TaxID=1221996 RepID=UPI0021BC233C|nr:GNAT family N-acetyltransferase [Bacillus thermotolerans]
MFSSSDVLEKRKGFLVKYKGKEQTSEYTYTGKEEKQMNIEHENGRFFIEKDGELLAELTYAPAGSSEIEVDHTYVSDELRGQGVAGQLVDEAAEYAREQNKKIIPTCTYAKAKMERDEKYKDVLAQ